MDHFITGVVFGCTKTKAGAGYNVKLKKERQLVTDIQSFLNTASVIDYSVDFFDKVLVMHQLMFITNINGILYILTEYGESSADETIPSLSVISNFTLHEKYIAEASKADDMDYNIKDNQENEILKALEINGIDRGLSNKIVKNKLLNVFNMEYISSLPDNTLARRIISYVNLTNVFEFFNIPIKTLMSIKQNEIAWINGNELSSVRESQLNMLATKLKQEIEVIDPMLDVGSLERLTNIINAPNKQNISSTVN